MSVLVFANGDLQEVEWLAPYLDSASAIIAADGGLRHLLALKVIPEVLVGDLDSLPAGFQDKPDFSETEVIAYPEDKDETDLELALLYATAKYDDEILVIAGLGGRLDQLLANILLLVHPELRDRPVRFLTNHQRIWLVGTHTEIKGEPGDTVSLIPLGGDVRVATTRGLRWPLEDELLRFGPARGVSNEMLSEVASVSVASGHLLCVHTHRVWRR